MSEKVNENLTAEELEQMANAYVGVGITITVREDGKGHIGKADYTTETPRVFACGDIRRGPSLVVWAIAEGRACAKAVDRYLEGYTNL